VVREMTQLLSTREELRGGKAAAEANGNDFENLANWIPAIVWTADADGQINYYNQYWHELVGPSAVTVGDASWTPKLHPDDLEMAKARWQSCVESGVPFSLEHRIFDRKRGEYRWFLGRARPVRDGNQNIVKWIGSTAEIHEQKLAEEAMAVSERRYRAFFDALPNKAWVLTPAGTIEFFNQRWVEYTGQPARPHGDAWMNAVHPEDRSVLIAERDRSLLSGQRYEVEVRLQHEAGEYRWHLGRVEPLRDPQGRLFGWLGSATDIHDIRQAQIRAREKDRALRESSERLLAALEASGTGTFRWDIRTNALTWDESLDRLFGLSPGVTARSLQEFIARVHPDDRSGVIERCERCRTEGTDFYMEFRVIWPDGSLRWLSDKGKTFCDENGQPAYMTGACLDITESKRTADSLREALARYHFVSQATNDVVWDWDYSADVVTWNAALEKTFGYDLSTVSPNSSWWLQRIHPDDAPTVFSSLALAREQGGETWQKEYRFRRADGSYARVFDRAFILRDAKGQPFRLVGSMLDQTSRLEAEAALRASEQRFSQLADAMPQIVWVANAEGVVEYLNRQWSEFTGLQLEQSTGHAWAQIVHPNDREGTVARWTEAFEKAVPYEHEMRYRRHDGAYRWHLVRAIPVRDASGLLRYFGTATDVHDRYELFERLRSKQAVLDQAQRVSSMGWFEWNIETGKNTWSPQLEAIYGLGAGQFPGTYADWLALVVPEDRATADGEIQRSFESGEFMTDFRIQRQNDGEVRWLHARARIVRNGAGNPERMVGINVDVTERKLAEQALASAREAAELANRAKDDFIAALSHELRTPLSPVLMTAQSLLMDPTLPVHVREDIALIRRSVEIETRLIDDLLDLTAISRGKIQLRPEPVDVHEALGSAIRTCRDESFQAKDLTLTLNANAEEHWVKADGARLIQVFWNLLKNAVKFTPAAGSITVNTRNEGACIEITVSDTGIGIPSETLPKVFAAFEQGSGTITRQFGGLGLGLAIARTLAELHGGTIAAHSEGPGRGAHFVVRLPVISRTEPARECVETNPPKNLPAFSAKKRRLLVVEDHEHTAHILGRLLSKMGHEVLIATKVAEAIELATRSQPIDLVLSDLGLPDGTGHELMAELRQRFDVKGIALSGFGMESDFTKSRSAGFEDHLIKPVSVDRLREVIERLLG
jgi:PAS domain S-box-containing protein